MKKIVVVLVCMLFSVSFVFSQEQKDTAVITFDKTIFELGNVSPGSHPFEFSFTNTGKGVLLVSNVNPTCGCTVATWTKEPIKPGGKGFVKVTYTGNAIGTFTKSLSVFSNSKTPVTTLSFRVTVADPSKENQEKTAASTTK